jgi:hypothetical protein
MSHTRDTKKVVEASETRDPERLRSHRPPSWDTKPPPRRKRNDGTYKRSVAGLKYLK